MLILQAQNHLLVSQVQNRFAKRRQPIGSHRRKRPWTTEFTECTGSAWVHHRRLVLKAKTKGKGPDSRY